MNEESPPGVGAGDAAPRPVGGERLVVALVRGAHGLAGAVRVEILTDNPELRYAPGTALFREGDGRPLTIDWSSAVADGPGWRVHFREIGSRSAAEELKGTYLEATVGAEAPLGRGEYRWHEVIGATVSGVDGTVLGTVRDVYRSGGAEVYTVNGGPYGEFDVPGVRAFVRVFAPRRGEIVIDAEALDLRPPKRASADPDRPRAPRRRPGPRRPKTKAAPPTDGPAGAEPSAEGTSPAEDPAAPAPPSPAPPAPEPPSPAPEPDPDSSSPVDGATDAAS